MKKYTGFILVTCAIFFGLPLLGLLRLAVQHRMQGGMMSIGSSIDVKAGTAIPPYIVTQTTEGRGMLYPNPPVPGFVPGTSQAFVKTAQLSLLVPDVRDAESRITDIITQRGGAITFSNITQSSVESDAVNGYITVRVPADKLDDTRKELKQLATNVIEDSVTAVDQTSARVDVNAQIQDLVATEQQFLSLLKQAKTIDETISIQKELTDVRSQITSLQAEQQRINTDVAMSSLSISLSTKLADRSPFGATQNNIIDELKLAFRDMVHIYRTVFVAGLRVVIIAFPLFIVAIVGWIVWKQRSKHHQ